MSPFRRACVDGPGDRVPYLKEMRFFFRGVAVVRGEVFGFPGNGGSPIAGWFSSWNILLMWIKQE